ncbi:MAG: hypothetical protein M3680_11770, partial [Myxococcota bacterium]|nr:hypothetical protein [Myxococcota bacterium]
SEPSGSRFTPVPFPLTSREPSAPAVAPSEYQVKRSSKLPIVIALALVVLGGAAIAAFSLFGDDQRATAPAADEQATTPMPALPTDPVSSAGSGTGSATPDPLAADPAAADPPGADQAAADPAALAEKTASKSAGTGKRNVGKRGAGKVVKDPKAATTKPPKHPVIEPPKPIDVPKQPADPFSSPRPTPRDPN